MKYLIGVLVVVMTIGQVSAQDVYTSSGRAGYHKKKAKKGYDPSKVIIGAEPTVSFGDGYVDAGLSGLLGYRFTKRFSAGIGLGYLYSQIPYDIPPASYSIKENIIYPNLWTQYSIARNWFVTVQYEYDLIFQSYPGYDGIHGYPVTLHSNVTNSCLFGGIGYKMPLGGRAFAYIEVLYDVLQGTNSPYGPGFPTTLRAGFAVGL